MFASLSLFLSWRHLAAEGCFSTSTWLANARAQSCIIILLSEWRSGNDRARLQNKRQSIIGRVCVCERARARAHARTAKEELRKQGPAPLAAVRILIDIN